MNLTNLALVPYFVVFVSVLAMIIFSYKGRAYLKVLAVALTFYMASSIYFSFETYKGWPVVIDRMPQDEKMRLLWAEVYEPRDGREGLLFVWVRPFSVTEVEKEATVWEHLNPLTVFGFKPLFKITPRAYSIPYDQLLAKELQESREAIKKGYRVQFTYEKPKTLGEGTQAGNKKGKAVETGDKTSSDDLGVPVERRPEIKLKIEVPGSELDKPTN
jgi:hypothetical protein